MLAASPSSTGWWTSPRRRKGWPGRSSPGRGSAGASWSSLAGRPYPPCGRISKRPRPRYRARLRPCWFVSRSPARGCFSGPADLSPLFDRRVDDAVDRRFGNDASPLAVKDKVDPQALGRLDRAEVLRVDDVGICAILAIALDKG